MLALLLLWALRGWGQARELLAPLPETADRVLIEARVDSVPGLSADGWQFDAVVAFPRQPGWPPRRLRLRLPAAAPAPQVGDLWQYAARLEAPADWRGRRALLRDHLSGEARVATGPLTRRLAPAAGGLDGLRARLARRISDRVADPSAAALLAALAVGATGEVTPRQWQVFNATGITHLVAISGMHVTFFAMLSMAAARRAWGWLAGRCPLPRREAFAAGVGVTMALLYALLSGFSVPAQRTVLMLAAFLLARECARRTRPAWSIAVALVAVLLHDPFALLGAGFWLSFLAVGSIVLVEGARLAPAAPLAAAAGLQWLVTVALLPATVAIFGSFAAIGLLANALAIPMFTLLLVPPVLLATACYLLPPAAIGWCGDWLVQVAGLAAAMLWPFLAWCAGLPAALWWAHVPWSWFLLAVPAAFVAVLPLAPLARGLAMALLASAFLLRAPRPPAGELWLDVQGEGRSQVVLLRTRGHLLLWGTGEGFGSKGRGFERRVLPWLRAAGYPRLDLWFPGSLTRDAQAAVGLASAMLPLAAVRLPSARGVPPEMHPCGEARWQWDGLGFEAAASGDGRGCRLQVRHGDQPAVELGGTAATPFAVPPGGVLALRLDARSLRPRRAALRL
jgi:competence protein ComEC